MFQLPLRHHRKCHLQECFVDCQRAVGWDFDPNFEELLFLILLPGPVPRGHVSAQFHLIRVDAPRRRFQRGHTSAPRDMAESTFSPSEVAHVVFQLPELTVAVVAFLPGEEATIPRQAWERVRFLCERSIRFSPEAKSAMTGEAF